MTEEGGLSHNELSGDYYRRLCDHAAVALAATDVEFRIVCWNASAESLLGRTAADMLGKPITDIIPGRRRNAANHIRARRYDALVSLA